MWIRKNNPNATQPRFSPVSGPFSVRVGVAFGVRVRVRPRDLVARICGAVGRSLLRARKHSLVGSRYGGVDPTQPLTLTLSLSLTLTLTLTQNGPKTDQNEPKRTRNAAAPRFEISLLFRSTNHHIAFV